MQNVLELPPAQRAEGKICPPGSKSISNRVLPLCALSKDATTVYNLPDGEDVVLMQKALHALGVKMDSQAKGLKIQGIGGGFHAIHPLALHLGNSGTCMRNLAALLACSNGEFFLDGVKRMRERPLGPLVEALLKLNPHCKVEYVQKEGFPPIRVKSKGFYGGTTSISGEISSQFTTAVLLALPLGENQSQISIRGKQVSKPYVDMTCKIMKQFGVEVIPIENDYKISAGSYYRSPREYFIEPDASSASYFLAAGAIAHGPVTIPGITPESLQGEAGFAKILEKMGAKVHWSSQGITVSGGLLQGIDVDMDSMTDTGMTLGITALFAKGKTTIRNVGNWRHKETDRLEAMAKELSKLGAKVEKGEDHLTIEPPEKIKPATISTYDDHRMAMCFSLACLGGVPITIENPNCTHKTYPGYFKDFQSIIC